MARRAWGRRALPVASPLTKDVSTAVVTGEVGALLASATLMVIYAMDWRKGPLFPFEVFGAFLVGQPPSATSPAGDGAVWDVSAALLGLLGLQMLPALAWSVIFGLF